MQDYDYYEEEGAESGSGGSMDYYDNSGDYEYEEDDSSGDYYEDEMSGEEEYYYDDEESGEDYIDNGLRETATVRPMFSKSMPKRPQTGVITHHVMMPMQILGSHQPAGNANANEYEDYEESEQDTFSQSPEGWTIMRPDLANVWQ